MMSNYFYLKRTVQAKRLHCSFWRSGWDSNPRAVARKLISSQPRYDLFDTAPYNIWLTFQSTCNIISYFK